jgi:DNA-binding NarL/FixJ family response regulator
MSVRILLVDDHPLVREGLRRVLEAVPHFEIVGEAASGEEALEAAGALSPDVVVMDLKMPNTNGIDATRRLANEGSKAAVLVLTMFEDDVSVFAALRAGARGYVLKGADQDEIVRAIEAVAHGESIFGAAIAERMLLHFRSQEHETGVLPELTKREREILSLLVDGLDSPAISRKLGISPKTVSNQISAILTKLQVADRAQAVVKGRRAGLGNR